MANAWPAELTHGVIVRARARLKPEFHALTERLSSASGVVGESPQTTGRFITGVSLAGVASAGIRWNLGESGGVC